MSKGVKILSAIGKGSLRSLQTKRLIGFLGVALIATIVGAIALFVPLSAVQELENRTWDWRLQASSQPTRADKSIKLIIIDQGSLDFFEREYGVTWPIPRDAYQYVINFLTAAGARGLAFDMLFTESSAQARETDLMLAEASAGKLPVVNAVAMETFDKFLDPKKFELFARLQKLADQERGFSTTYLSTGHEERFLSATLPIPEILERPTTLGSVYANPDSDGIFRRYNMGGYIKDIPILSLPFALYDRAGGKPANLQQFLDSKGRLTVFLHGPANTYDTYSLASVIQAQAAREAGETPKVDPAEFKDAWVLLGVWAPGLLDLRPTPLEEKGKGVEYVAAVLDNLIHQNFVRILEGFGAFALTTLYVILAAILAVFLHNPQRQAFYISSVLISLCLLGYWSSQQGWWLPMVAPLLGMVTAIVLGIGYQFQLEGRQHRFVKGAFQYYVSRSVIDKIIENPQLLSLGGERRDLTIFFSDIAGFTSISEQLDPTKLVLMLNEYLTLMTDTILETKGTVDKYVGDAVVAFWNAPIPIENHAQQAVLAAKLCQRRLAEREEFFIKEFGVTLKTRIGLHTGAVSVGNFGSKSRFNYTIIGDSANLASRLEGVNKVFGTRILISQTTLDALGPETVCRKIAALRVVGKSEAVNVYEPHIPELQNFSIDQLEPFTAAIRAFEAGQIESARSYFEQHPTDGPSQSYLSRIKKEQLDLQVPQGWSPVWNMTEK